MGGQQLGRAIAIAIERRVSNGLVLVFLRSSFVCYLCGKAAVTKRSLVELLAIVDEYPRTTRRD